jgi:hypothetical protein
MADESLITGTEYRIEYHNYDRTQSVACIFLVTSCISPLVQYGTEIKIIIFEGDLSIAFSNDVMKSLLFIGSFG